MIRDIEISMEFSKTNIEKYKEFNMSTKWVTDVYLRMLVELKVQNIKKILIECAEHTINKVANYDNDDLGVQIVRRQIDLNKYLELSDVEKKKWGILLLISGFEEVHKHFNFPIEKIHSVSKELNNIHFVNHYYLKKPVPSPNNQYKAILWVEYEIQKFSLFVHLFNKEEKIIKKVLIKTVKPGWISYFPILGNIIWKSVNEFQVYNRKKKVLKTIRINNISEEMPN